MQISTDGLIIMEKDVGESDRLVTVLSREEGVLRAFAQRANKMKSSKLSATQLLCYSRLTIYKGRDKYIIDDAQPLRSFLSSGKILSAFPLPNTSASWRVRSPRRKRRRGIFCVWCSMRFIF